MQIRRNVIFNKAGGNASKNSYSYKISLPADMIRDLGVTESDRGVIIAMENGTITIRKEENKERFMENRKISDLVSDAFEEDDYKFRINFLLAGLMSAEGNDTPEKEENNRKLLAEIRDYLRVYDGDAEKTMYASRTLDAVNNFITEDKRDDRR